jgi:hypothetical protein
MVSYSKLPTAIAKARRIQGMVFQAPKSERKKDRLYHVEYGHTAETKAYGLVVVWKHGGDA